MATACQVDSDEEDVFWGPVTMKEIKVTFKKELEELNCRRTAEIGNHPTPSIILDSSLETNADTKSRTLNGSTKNLEKNHISPLTQESIVEDSGNGNLPTDIKPEEGTCFASTPQKRVNILSGDTGSPHSNEKKLNSSNFTPISSPMKENCSSTYTTPSLASQSQNDCDSSFASVASSFVDESDSPALEIASESFEKVDPQRYSVRSINIPDVIGSHMQSPGFPLLQTTSNLNSQSSEKISLEYLSKDFDSVSNKSAISEKTLPQTSPGESKIDRISTSSIPSASVNKLSHLNGGASDSTDYISRDSLEKPDSYLSSKEEQVLGVRKTLPEENKNGTPRSLGEKFLNGDGLSQVAKGHDLKLSAGFDWPSCLDSKENESPLKPFNISHLTEADLSDVSPPNITVFDDTVMSINQTQLSTVSKLETTSKLPGKKYFGGGSNLPRFSVRLPHNKKLFDPNVPKAAEGRQNLGGVVSHSVSSSKTCNSPKLLESKKNIFPAPHPTHTPSELVSAETSKIVTPKESKKLVTKIVSTEEKALLNKNTPFGEKTTQKYISSSGRKEKFFQTPPSVKYSNSKRKQGAWKASPLDPKVDRLSPSHLLKSTPSSFGSITKKNGTCEKLGLEPKKKFFLAPHPTHTPSGLAKTVTPKIVTPNLNSSSNIAKTYGFSKNNTLSSEHINSTARSRIPSTSIPKFFPRNVKNTHRNQENLPSCSLKSEDLESPIAPYSSDSSLPLSDASFNSSVNSNKSLISGIHRLTNSFIEPPQNPEKKQPMTRLPRLNVSSRIPKVHAADPQTSFK